ncbi:MAG: DUF3373 domain-containing protein [Desulfuromonadaceae bacterium]|nr:DUF3373 domain-containing protein [Desulfuromonadaceae bacterium]
MKKKSIRKIAVAVMLALMVPLAAHASEEDLQLKIDKLSKEIADLKGSVKKVEDKSLSKWLSIGGEYRFRVDSLRGETVPYTNAIGTMMNMVGGFTAPTGVAGTNIGGFVSPSATQFIMQGKAGSLFTPAQFNTMLNQYMPQAMGASLPGLFTAMGSPGFNPASIPPLTVQQQAILNTMSVKVMPTVMGMQVGSIPGMTAVLPPGTPTTTTVGQVFSGFPPASQQLAMQMLMQGFLGADSGNLDFVPSYKPKNETLYTNKFGLDLTAKPIKDITVHASLGMYKAFGSQTDTPTVGNYFADRVGAFDGTIGHIPTDSKLNVDRAYATWGNIADEPIWFSVGRRPSTNGAPSHLRLNRASPGSTGTPALLVDYAFDGVVLGYAPDIDTLPGASAKVCYGRGFESGFQTADNSIKDTDMLGVSVIPIDTDPLRIWLQWNRGFNIFDFPAMNNTVFGNTAPAANLGNIDWYGAGAMSTLKKVGPGTLQLFGDLGMSVAHPNGNVSNNAGFQGLMSGAFFAQDFTPEDRTGWAVYTGIRYDLPSKTKIGFEFNHGSKYWITFAPSADDMWTSKVGTRGNVYEPYIIQELNLKPISSYFAKAFFKLGYQYYDFEYTGSNNWVGAPVKISDIKATDLMLMAPMKSAYNIYGTFEVHF